MRYVLSIFLISILLQHIITTQDILYRMARASKALRNLIKYKRNQMRKLQEKTDEVSEQINTIPSDIPPDTQKAANETLNEKPVIYENNNDVKLPSDLPVTNEKNGTASLSHKFSVLQVRKFHNFRKIRGTRILIFRTLLYFFNRPLVKTVVIRITIKYKNSGRYIRRLVDDDKIAGESVRTVCQIDDAYEGYVNKLGNGNNIDYNCMAETTSSAEVEVAKIDSRLPMVVGNESVPIEDIEFHEDAEEGLINLVNSPNQSMVVLKDTEYETTPDNKKLYLKGTLLPANGLKESQDIDIDFYDISENQKKNIKCKVQTLDTKSGECTIECDTSETPLETNYGNLTLSSHKDEDLYFTINIREDAARSKPVKAGYVSNNTYYRKKSGGLSGGAIAGIVIACFVVIAAASIAAIMLRKPKQYADSNTVVGLKTVEDISK